MIITKMGSQIAIENAQCRLVFSFSHMNKHTLYIYQMLGCSMDRLIIIIILYLKSKNNIDDEHKLWILDHFDLILRCDFYSILFSQQLFPNELWNFVLCSLCFSGQNSVNGFEYDSQYGLHNV